MYFDINSYVRIDQGKEVLRGAERRIAISFRYCNYKGGMGLVVVGVQCGMMVGVKCGVVVVV